MGHQFIYKGRSQMLDTFLLNITIQGENGTKEFDHVIYHPTFGFCDPRLLEMDGVNLSTMDRDCRDYLREKGVLAQS